MKRNMAYVLMLVSAALICYALETYAEDPKAIKGSEFTQSYIGKNIKELINFLGKPNDVKENTFKRAKPGFEQNVYIWYWTEIDKLPVKIINDDKEGTTPYYVDHIKAKTEGGDITEIRLVSKNKFVIP